ncbi:MAG: phospholipase D family protein [Pseudomonadales bacterium]|nr:phospholipase D family protein [Pseudomonadales bacterium]
MSLSKRLVCATAMLCMLVACATVQPERERTAERALAPAAMEHWPGLTQLQDTDYIAVLNLGPGALQWRLRTLRAATRSIDLQTFIWRDDSAGLAVLREIIAAADRGVRVRILLDDSFLAHADPMLRALQKHPSIHYRIYNPLAHRGGNLVVREMENITDFSRINHRMHNKLLVVDGRIAIIGGRNQADEYFGIRDGQNFRDFELVTSGPFTQEFSDVFDLYWNDPWSIPIEHLVAAEDAGDITTVRDWLGPNASDHEDAVQTDRHDWASLFQGGFSGEMQLLVDAPPDASPALDAPVQLGNALVEEIDAVQSDLVLISAYFIPTEALTNAIERATDRGVRVRILTNSLGSNNHVGAHAAYAKHRPALLLAGAELYELRPDADTRELYLDAAVVQSILGLHAKAMIMDQCCVFMGSANMDPRSLRLNTELGVLIDSPELNAKVRQLLDVDMQAQNAWRVELDERGGIVWVGEDGTLRHAPPASFYLRAESWFFGLLPIEGQM